ncbi:MAG: hypothetical protein ACRD9Q_02400 [Nitrososphaeraceae archaeon]
MSESKKSVLEKRRIPYNIMRCIDWGNHTHSQILQTLSFSKPRLHYWYRKLSDEGFIERPFRGYYELTTIGKKALRGYELQEGKGLVRLENMRYSFPILKNYDYLLSLRWNNITKLNHISIIHHKVYGYTVRIICSSKNPSIEVSCKQILGTDIYEMMYQAKRDALAISEIFQDDTKVVLGEPKPAMEPEWAIPSPLSEALLSMSSSSQISTPLGTLNRSKGRNADLEVRDPRHAVSILEMPKRIERIEKMLALMSGYSSQCLFL